MKDKGTALLDRRHVVILGDTNVGKSSLFNALLGQDCSIVSKERGTTTDPVIKGMELLPFGPITLIDTAGSFDESALGEKRAKKTEDVTRRADVAIYVIDASTNSQKSYAKFLEKNVPHLCVFSKKDLLDESALNELKSRLCDVLFISTTNEDDICLLREKLSELLKDTTTEESSILKGLLEPKDVVLLVVPLDLEAPKGRLILPQVQMIRDCLDNDISVMVTKESELENTLSILKNIDLVITDSQAFGFVNKIVPSDIPLTSFSMLLANRNGDFNRMYEGINAISDLKNGSKILVSEGCSHNHTHDDIARYKIPEILREKSHADLIFDFVSGYDFPQDLSIYSLVVSCGGCMLTKAEKTARSKRLKSENVPATNYGMVLAYGSGILERSAEIFNRK